MRQKAVWSFVFLIVAWGVYFGDVLQGIFFKSQPLWITGCHWGIVIASLCLTFSQRQQFRSQLVVSSQVGIFLLFLLEVGFIIGAVFTLPFLQIVSIILMVPALVLAIFGPFICQTIFSALLYFLLIIPLQMDQIADSVPFVFMSVVLFLLLLSQRHLTQDLKIEPPLWTYQNSRWLVPTAIIFGFFMTGPWLGDNIRHFYPPTDRLIVLRAPLGSHGWLGPTLVKTNTWTPFFSKASATLTAQYLSEKKDIDASVNLYTAYFNSDRAISELFDPHNVLFNQKIWTEISTKIAEVTLQDGSKTRVLEMVLTAPTSARVIWYWYYVAGVATLDTMLANVLDKVRVIAGDAQGSGIVVLSSAYRDSPEEARSQLSDFMKGMYVSLEVLKRPEIHFERRTHLGK